MRGNELTVRQALPNVYHLRDALDARMTLLVGTRRALLWDAGYGLCDLREKVRAITALPLTVLCSHAHYDHALGCRRFPRAYLSQTDFPARAQAIGPVARTRVLSRARDMGVTLDEGETARYLADGRDPFAPLRASRFDLGGMGVQVVPMPGHTPGSIGLWVPARRLLLPGDNLNPVLWLFLADSMPLATYAKMLRGVLGLPFAHALCPHDDRLYSRAEVQALANGLTASAMRHARPVRIPGHEEVAAMEFAPAPGFTLVFDGKRDLPEQLPRE